MGLKANVSDGVLGFAGFTAQGLGVHSVVRVSHPWVYSVLRGGVLSAFAHLLDSFRF